MPKDMRGPTFYVNEFDRVGKAQCFDDVSKSLYPIYSCHVSNKWLYSPDSLLVYKWGKGKPKGVK